jgi:hypothetical protein
MIHSLRMVGRVAEGNAAAHRVTDEREPLQPKLVDERRQVGRHRLRPVVGRPVAVAVAALVERVDVIGIAQMDRDAVPVARLGGKAVQQHQRRIA